MKKYFRLLIDLETVNSNKNEELPGITLPDVIYLHVISLKEIVAGWKSHAIKKLWGFWPKFAFLIWVPTCLKLVLLGLC